MARKKAQSAFLTKEELPDFLDYIEENKITQTRMAEIQGVSEGTISTWLKKGEVLRALRDNVKCRIEKPQLEEKLKKAKEHLED